jgi:hypothetical protein
VLSIHAPSLSSQPFDDGPPVERRPSAVRILPRRGAYRPARDETREVWEAETHEIRHTLPGRSKKLAAPESVAEIGDGQYEDAVFGASRLAFRTHDDRQVVDDEVDLDTACEPPVAESGERLAVLVPRAKFVKPEFSNALP